MNYELKILTQKADMLPHWQLIQQLNPSVTADYMAAMLDDMLAHGYRMATVWDGVRCIALSGIWTGTKLYSGKYLEMDNVVVDAAYRSKGVGQLLTDFVVEMARKEGVRTMMLDAYKENTGAHAFYERNRFVNRGYHFLRFLDQENGDD
jgi:ribosomal protein S18 acetylase RimI-like enzyme